MRLLCITNKEGLSRDHNVDVSSSRPSASTEQFHTLYGTAVILKKKKKKKGFYGEKTNLMKTNL